MKKSSGRHLPRLRWFLGVILLFVVLYGLQQYLPWIIDYFKPRIAFLNQQINLSRAPRTFKIEYFDLTLPTKKNVKNPYQLLVLKSTQFTQIDRMKARLALLGFATNTQIKYLKQQKYYLLWIGTFETIEEVQKIQAQLKKQGIITEIDSSKISRCEK